jgi:hypothetical protein
MAKSGLRPSPCPSPTKRATRVNVAIALRSSRIPIVKTAKTLYHEAEVIPKSGKQ